MAHSAFSCRVTSYIRDFIAPFCAFITRKSITRLARDWATNAWNCLVKIAVEDIQSTYGGYRYDDPLQWECQKVSREAFARQKACIQETLCDTPFTAADSYHFVNVLESSSVFRDHNAKQFLDILKPCGEDNDNVSSLREELWSRGFVLCFVGEIEDFRNETVKQTLRLIQNVSKSEVTELTNASNICIAPRRQSTVVIAVLSSGTNAISQDSLCDSLHMTSMAVTLQCPVCPNNVLELPSEECDDGNTKDGDGCSSTCTIEQAFTCITTPWRTSECRHYDIDLNRFDNTTRNRSVVIFHGNETAFVANNHSLDASDYGNEVGVTGTTVTKA